MGAPDPLLSRLDMLEERERWHSSTRGNGQRGHGVDMGGDDKECGSRRWTDGQLNFPIAATADEHSSCQQARQ